MVSTRSNTGLFLSRSEQDAMTEQQKHIFEHFARAKGYYQRNEIERGLASILMGVKLFMENRLVGREKLEFDNVVLELIQTYSRDEFIAEHFGELQYEKGKEKALLVSLARCLKAMGEAKERESLEASRERKLQLDRCILRGEKLLKAGKTAEAEEQFQQAQQYYVDEHPLFHIIAGKYLAAEQPKNALPYLARGLELQPGDLQTLLLTARAHELLKDYEQSLRFLDEVLDLHGETSDRLTKKAEFLARLKRVDEAKEILRRVLATDPAQLKAKRLLAKLGG